MFLQLNTLLIKVIFCMFLFREKKFYEIILRLNDRYIRNFRKKD